jgi:hypothetical protein
LFGNKAKIGYYPILSIPLFHKSKASNPQPEYDFGLFTLFSAKEERIKRESCGLVFYDQHSPIHVSRHRAEMLRAVLYNALAPLLLH